ncbi:MAG: hypothetical protein ABJL99_23645 [Aliishimia sp.]
MRRLNVAALTQEWHMLDLPREDIPRCVLPELRPWGMIKAHTVDPDGNLLVYGATNEAVPKDIQT